MNIGLLYLRNECFVYALFFWIRCLTGQSYKDKWIQWTRILFTSNTWYSKSIGSALPELVCIALTMLSKPEEETFLVQDDPKILDDGGEVPEYEERGWRFDFLVVNSPLYLTKTCQVTNCLTCFGVGMSAFCPKKREKGDLSFMVLRLSETFSTMRLILDTRKRDFYS